jgi:serine/threonine protein kinase
MGEDAKPAFRTVGRYALFGPIGSGGMATVHFGRLMGPVGFARTVAIKRLHPHFAAVEEFVASFVDEARLAARVSHPNVLAALDVLHQDRELLLVMDYVPGETLARLARSSYQAGEPFPVAIAASIICGVLQGLHAAHEAKNEAGQPLGIVHRDVSPHNVLVGTDGIARVLDFGVAKATGRLQTTRAGQVKGKFAYMSPEQLLLGELTRQADVYAAAVILWELLAGRKLFHKESEGGVVYDILEGSVDPPSHFNADVSHALDAVVMQGLARDTRERFATARQLAQAIETATAVAPTWQVGEWVERRAGEALARRAREVAEVERCTQSTEPTSLPRLASVPAQTAAPPSEGPQRDFTQTESKSAVVPRKVDSSPPASLSAEKASVSNEASGGRARILGGVALAFAITAAAALFFAQWGSRPHAMAGPAATPAPPPPVSVPASSAVDIAPALPPPVVAATTQPTASPVIARQTAAAKPLPPTTPKPARSAAKERPASGAPGGCDPPYTEDSAGIRYPKPQCL